MATPDFILKLREKIGHGPLWLIGISAYVEDSHGRILLGRRADTGEWALVYGINEPGEEPADTVIREVQEETGVSVVPVALIAVKAADHLTIYDNGDQCQYLDLMYECRLADGAAAEARVADEESLAVGWFEPDALPQPLAASTAVRLATVRAFRARRAAGDARSFFGSELTDTADQPGKPIA